MVGIFEKEFSFNLVKIQRHLKGANQHNFGEPRRNNRLTAPRIYVPVILKYISDVMFVRFGFC